MMVDIGNNTGGSKMDHFSNRVEKRIIEALAAAGIKARLWEKHGLRRLYISAVPGHRIAGKLYIDLTSLAGLKIVSVWRGETNVYNNDEKKVISGVLRNILWVNTATKIR